MKYADIDRIYQKIPLDDISWNSGTPPDALAYLVPGGGAHLLTFCRPRYTVGEYPPREPRYITTALGGVFCLNNFHEHGFRGLSLCGS